MIRPTKAQIYWTNKELEFAMKQRFSWVSLMEAGSNGEVALVPRFSLNNSDIFTELPSNEPMKPTTDIIKMAIKWGMLMEIDYKGEEDEKWDGHDRVIYPLVFGYSKANKPLIRGWHFKGWSVSGGGHLEKEWRMFRFDRILNITFTGSFFRLAPDGYKMNDKGIHDIVAAADFNDIRNLQAQLLNQNKIDLKDNLELNKINELKVKSLNRNFKLHKPYEGDIIKKKDAKNTRMVFCKPLAANQPWIVIFGINIKKGNTFKVKDELGKMLGTYTSHTSIMASTVDRYKTLEEQIEFRAYAYMDAN